MSDIVENIRLIRIGLIVLGCLGWIINIEYRLIKLENKLKMELRK